MGINIESDSEEWRQFSRGQRSRARAGRRCEFLGPDFGASAHPIEAGAQPVSQSPGVPEGSSCYAGDSGILRPARDLGESKMSGGNAPPPRPPLYSAQDKRNKSAIGGFRRERWGPERMARAELYREFARKCLELGYKVAPESRRVLFEMARIWQGAAP